MIRKIYFTIALLLSATMMFAQENTVKLETRTFSIIGKDTLKLDAFYKSPSTPPLLVHIHGGFVTSSRINAAQEVCCRYMAEQGRFAINVDYSLAGIHVNEDKTISNPYKVKGELEER